MDPITQQILQKEAFFKKTKKNKTERTKSRFKGEELYYGKFRFTRVFNGSDPEHNSHWKIHGYWDVGGGWYEHWDTMWGTKAEFEVRLSTSNGNGNGEVTMDWDNLISV